MLQQMEMRQRTSSQKLRKEMESHFNIGLGPTPGELNGMDDLHLHTLSEHAMQEGLESLDAENPQARSEGIIDDEEGAVDMVAEKMFGAHDKQDIDF